MTVMQDARNGELVREAALAPAVTMRWNPAAPAECARNGVELLGTDVEAVRDAVSPPGSAAAQWCRLASLAALDHLLRVPLNRSLLDAERAGAELDAARTLPEGEQTREWLIRKALHRARLAVPGVVQYLDRLTVDDCCPPAALSAAVETLRACYSALAGEASEPDGELDSIVEACRRLAMLDGSGVRNRGPAPFVGPVLPAVPAEDFLDPRRLPAHRLGFAQVAEVAEISVAAVQWKGRPAVRVRVPASGLDRNGDLDVAVRLVDRRSGDVCCNGLLGGLVTQPPRTLGGIGERYYEGTVVLPAALAAEDVRVDVHDAASGWPTPPADHEELRRARQAPVILSAWRSLVADVRLWGAAAKPAARLRSIVRELPAGASGDRAAQLWTGGPVPSTLLRLAVRGDRSLTAVLCGRVCVRLDGNARALVESVSGAGELLIAELAAAYDRSIVI
jgi:hypothetical protein